jgi:hypothetical protein
MTKLCPYSFSYCQCSTGYRLKKLPSCAEDWSGETSWIYIHVGSLNIHPSSILCDELNCMCLACYFASMSIDVLLHACLSLTSTTNSIRHFSLNYIHTRLVYQILWPFLRHDCLVCCNNRVKQGARVECGQVKLDLFFRFQRTGTII